jgi:hypothetical protein
MSAAIAVAATPNHSSIQIVKVLPNDLITFLLLACSLSPFRISFYHAPIQDLTIVDECLFGRNHGSHSYPERRAIQVGSIRPERLDGFTKINDLDVLIAAASSQKQAVQQYRGVCETMVSKYVERVSPNANGVA